MSIKTQLFGSGLPSTCFERSPALPALALSMSPDGRMAVPTMWTRLPFIACTLPITILLYWPSFCATKTNSPGFIPPFPNMCLQKISPVNYIILAVPRLRGRLFSFKQRQPLKLPPVRVNEPQHERHGYCERRILGVGVHKVHGTFLSLPDYLSIIILILQDVYQRIMCLNRQQSSILKYPFVVFNIVIEHV